ncbi:hypothetical protein L226DRAFT_562624 [Lentinus tigrinus ALCF2SS1-7]
MPPVRNARTKKSRSTAPSAKLAQPDADAPHIAQPEADTPPIAQPKADAHPIAKPKAYKIAALTTPAKAKALRAAAKKRQKAGEAEKENIGTLMKRLNKLKFYEVGDEVWVKVRKYGRVVWVLGEVEKFMGPVSIEMANATLFGVSFEAIKYPVKFRFLRTVFTETFFPWDMKSRKKKVLKKAVLTKAVLKKTIGEVA